jgi:hypothetical protein
MTLGPASLSLELWRVWLTVNVLLSISPSLLVVYQAIGGYRRNGSRPMLLLALGVVLLTVVPTVVTICGTRLDSARTVGLIVSPVTNSIEALGVGRIVYSLYRRQ